MGADGNYNRLVGVGFFSLPPVPFIVRRLLFYCPL